MPRALCCMLSGVHCWPAACGPTYTHFITALQALVIWKYEIHRVHSNFAGSWRPPSFRPVVATSAFLMTFYHCVPGTVHLMLIQGRHVQQQDDETASSMRAGISEVCWTSQASLIGML